MTAYTFTIRTIERGQLVAQAVICLDARYASVQWQHRPSPDRRFAAPSQWKALQSELGDTLPATPLEGKTTIVQVLLGNKAPYHHVQYLSAEPISETRPDQVIVQLDQRLRQVQV